MNSSSGTNYANENLTVYYDLTNGATNATTNWKKDGTSIALLNMPFNVKDNSATDYSDYGMVLCCPMYGRIFIDLLDNDNLTRPFNSVLGEGCMIYALWSSFLVYQGFGRPFIRPNRGPLFHYYLKVRKKSYLIFSYCPKNLRL